MGTKKGVTEAQHAFAVIPKPVLERSTFNRSCGVKTTFNSGELIPIFVDEALPGDTFTMQMSLFARIATLVFPIMDNVYMDVFFFSVPMRLLWDNWEKFNGAQDDPGDSTDFTIPQMVSSASGGHLPNSLSDYLGIPTNINSLTHSSMFHRAYNFVWNEWFRDQNLQNKLTVDKDDGPDDPLDYIGVQKRGKRHDYFTSCLPFVQKGEAVTLPLGTSAPVVSDGDGEPRFNMGPVTDVSLTGTAVSGDAFFSAADTSNQDMTWNAPKLKADLSLAAAATINALRTAFQIQRLYERDARGGTRYTEILKAHFNVSSPDERLMRPEYLGGGSTGIYLTPVAQTNDKSGDPLGMLGAYGVAQGSGMGFTRSFVEHSIIIGLVASRADINYQQGLPRMFSRLTRWDFAWPALMHLGEQAVLNKEIFADASAADELTFGFQERFAEYRYKPSTITGQFRSNVGAPLDAWHLAQDFAGLPVLDASFIVENPPFDRIVAVTTEPDFLFDAFFDLKCARPMPTFSVPGQIDHF